MWGQERHTFVEEEEVGGVLPQVVQTHLHRIDRIKSGCECVCVYVRSGGGCGRRAQTPASQASKQAKQAKGEEEGGRTMCSAASWKLCRPVRYRFATNRS